MSGSSSQGSVTSGPPEWLQGPIQDYLGAANTQASKPFQNYDGMRVAPFTQLQNQAFQGIGNSMYGTPAMRQSDNFLSGLIGNTGTNPYLDSVIQRGQRGVTDAYNSANADITRRFNEPGQWAGSAHTQAIKNSQEALAQGLGDLESGVRYQDYTNNLNRQMQAIPLASQNAQAQQGLYSGGLQAGNLQQQYGQALVDSQYGDWQRANNYGWDQLDRYGGAMGRVMGGSGQTQTTQQPNNPWSSALGLGMLGYGLLG